MGTTAWESSTELSTELPSTAQEPTPTTGDTETPTAETVISTSDYQTSDVTPATTESVNWTSDFQTDYSTDLVTENVTSFSVFLTGYSTEDTTESVDLSSQASVVNTYEPTEGLNPSTFAMPDNTTGK